MLLGLMIEVLGWEMGAFRTNDIIGVLGWEMGHHCLLYS